VAAGRYTVIGFPRESELGRHDLPRLRRALSDSLVNNGAAGEATGLPALVIFDDADRFLEADIKEIFNHVHQSSRIGDHRIAGVVLLATTEFLARLEKPILRAWLAKRLFVARVRFHELGANEISAFIQNQLPLGKARSIFSNEAIAAIADVSGGDPAVVNRFARRVLGLANANAGDASTNAGSYMLSKQCSAGALEQPQRNGMLLELGTQLSILNWRDWRVNRRLCAVPVVCLICVAAVAAVVHIRSAREDIAAFASAPAKTISATRSDQASLTGLATPADDHMASAVTSPPEAAPETKPTAVTAVAAPTPEEALSAQPTAPSTPPVALRPEASPVPQAPGTMMATAIPLDPAGNEPRTTVISPAGTQAAEQTSSMRSPPRPQLRLPAEEITALLARGDKLLTLGDVSSARLFYERAADAGDERAALEVGKTFDPVFLYTAHLSVRGNSAMAVFWYNRARELGAAEAETLLNHLEPASAK
jgi:hypothetical protein